MGCCAALLEDDFCRSLHVAKISAGLGEMRSRRAATKGCCKEDSEEIVLIVTRSGRFMKNIFHQQEAEGLTSLEVPARWPIIAGKAHHVLCVSVVLQGLQSY